MRLHLIGPLQSNKCATPWRCFDAIHPVDRDKLSLALSRKWRGRGRTLSCSSGQYGEEPQKGRHAPGARQRSFVSAAG
jgi:uncharacterized pyridoxal phosphate-containing UPF0001 family protein